MTDLARTAPTVPPAVAHVARSCRGVIDAAGAFASVLLDDPTGLIARLRDVDPALGATAAELADSVLDLDHRTNYLGGPAAPAPQPWLLTSARLP